MCSRVENESSWSTTSIIYKEKNDRETAYENTAVKWKEGVFMASEDVANKVKNNLSTCY